MAGRGRGRGRGLLSSNVTPVTPGSGDYEALLVKLGHIRNAEEEKKKEENNKEETKTKGKYSIQDVEDMLNGLELDVEEEELNNFKQVSSDAAQTGDDLKQIAEIIYQKCLHEREFVKQGAMIASHLCTIEVDKTKFRNCVLTLLQKDFKDKEELRKESATQYLTFVATLCQMFGQMRTASGELFKPLVSPVCESLELILDEENESTADECEFLSLQLQAVGKELETAGSERLNKLMEKIRTKIINNGTSPRIRCTLLEVLEMYLRRFEELPNDVTRFYCDTMADILTGLVV